MKWALRGKAGVVSERLGRIGSSRSVDGTILKTEQMKSRGRFKRLSSDWQPRVGLIGGCAAPFAIPLPWPSWVVGCDVEKSSGKKAR